VTAVAEPDLRDEYAYYLRVAECIGYRESWHTCEDWAQEATIAYWQSRQKNLPVKIAFKAGRFRLGALNARKNPARQLGGMSVRFDRLHRRDLQALEIDELTEPGVDELLFADWEREAVIQAVEELPPRLRGYIKRRFWKGASKDAVLEREALTLLRERLAGDN
jgi:hypothetical protein